ncbi:MAG: hypothetical protein KC925_02555 [Candidatus Doudnabacteria bacterium]|nr:hypothetical protein [Candidatus Doudnabacteria bacterium]
MEDDSQEGDHELGAALPRVAPEPVRSQRQRAAHEMSRPPPSAPPVATEPPRGRTPEPSAPPGSRSQRIVAPHPSWMPREQDEPFDRRGVSPPKSGSLLIATSFDVRAVVGMLNVMADAEARFGEALRPGYVYFDPGVGLVEIDSRFTFGDGTPGSLHVPRQLLGAGGGLAGLQSMLANRGRYPLFGVPVAGLRSVSIWSASPGTRLDLRFPTDEREPVIRLVYRTGDADDSRFLRGVHQPQEDLGLLKPLVYLATGRGIHSSLVARVADIEAMQELILDLVLGDARHPSLPVGAEEAMALVQQMASERRTRRGD